MRDAEKSTGKLFRLRELAEAIFTTRGRKGFASLSNAFVAAVVAVSGWGAIAIASPAAVALLANAKTDFASLGDAMDSYADGWALDGWSYVATLDAPGIDSLALVVVAAFAGAWIVLALYAILNVRRGNRRNAFGGAISDKSGAKGTAHVETSAIVLASTTRTWKPGAPLEHAGLVGGYSPLLHRYYLSAEQDHTQTIAPPSVGKSTRVVLPTIHAILCSQDSAIIPDPKGELYDNTSEDAVRSGAKVICIDYANWRRSNLYNVMSEVTLIYQENMSAAKCKIAAAAEASVAGRTAEAGALALEARNHRIEALSRADSLAADLSEAIVPDAEGNDQFWRPSARSLLRALSLLVSTYEEGDWKGEGVAPSTPRPEQRTLKTIRHLLDRYGKPVKRQVGKSVEDYVPLEDLFRGLDPDHPASKAFAQAKNSPNMTLGGIISTLLQVIDSVIDEGSNMMSYATDFRFEDIARERTIVYLIVPEESPAKFAYLPIFMVQAYQAFARLARSNGGRMPRNVHFLEEEKGNTPKTPRYSNMIGTGRGYGMRFHAIMQNPYQWAKVYGDKEAESIRASFNLTLWLKFNDLASAKEFSDVIGTHTVSVDNAGSSKPVMGVIEGSTSTTERKEGSNLAPAEKLLAWDPLWGSFAKRTRIDRNGILNRLFFHRHEANVALFPTAKPQMLPTFRAFGMHRRHLAREKALRAQRIDYSAQRVVVPPWDAEELSGAQRRALEGVFEAGGVDAATQAAIEEEVWWLRARPDAVRAGHAMAAAFGGGDAREYADAAIESAKEQIKRSVAAANRQCKAMEESAGLDAPFSCEVESFKATRTEVRRRWLEQFAHELAAAIKERESK